MAKVLLKIRSFEVDHKKGKTQVIFHEWDGKYFCLSCALDRKNIELDGVVWNNTDEIKDEILRKKYGHNI